MVAAGHQAAGTRRSFNRFYPHYSFHLGGSLWRPAPPRPLAVIRRAVWRPAPARMTGLHLAAALVICCSVLGQPVKVSSSQCRVCV